MKKFIITATRKSQFIGDGSTQSDFIETFEYRMGYDCTCNDAKEHYESLNEAYEVIGVYDLAEIKTVSSFSELYPALHIDGQGSGTVEGWIIFNGRKLWVRKHWSNEFYCCFDWEFSPFLDKKDNTHKFAKQIGALQYDESSRRELIIDGVKQLHHGMWQLYDFDLELVPCNEN